MTTAKIDFVITWVDGNDPQWIQTKNKYINEISDFNGNNTSIRYRDYGTLKYVFRSIEKFTPWVNKIYLVTADQCPKWLNVDNSKVKLISHSDIIDQKYLPLFNSDPIEWNIDKIPNLSENFVYFNDDMLLNKTLAPKYFFKNNLPCDFRLYTDNLPIEQFYYIPFTNDLLINNFVNGKWPLSKKGLYSLKYGKHILREQVFLHQAKHRGIPGYIELHGPQPFQKSSFKKAKSIWSKQIEENNTHRFRQYNDISIWLVRHLQLELGSFTPTKSDGNTVYTILDTDNLKKDLEKSISNTFCINDVSVSSEKYETLSKEINNLLNAKYPNKSSFEKQ